jgi:hypothetical protein
MKAVLKTGTELQIASYSLLSDTRIMIAFIGNTSYDNLRSQLTIQALKEIKCYPDDNGTTFDVFENYTKILDPSNVTVATDGTYDVVITFEKEDEISQRISQNSEDIVSLFDAVNVMMTEIIPSMMAPVTI